MRTISELRAYVLEFIKESYAFFHREENAPYKSRFEQYIEQESCEVKAVSDLFALLDRMVALGVFPWGEVFEPTRTNILKSARKLIDEQRRLNIDEGIRDVKQAAATTTTGPTTSKDISNATVDELCARLLEVQQKLDALYAMVQQLIEAERQKARETTGKSRTSPAATKIGGEARPRASMVLKSGMCQAIGGEAQPRASIVRRFPTPIASQTYRSPPSVCHAGEKREGEPTTVGSPSGDEMFQAVTWPPW